ncbi:MAG TPA: molybdopterin-dependent oxidoreductase [Bryobacteraceae bacterium]|nr:molybdopterin-dependent oxidoreductase [Bryobacteraceae bacterium]
MVRREFLAGLAGARLLRPEELPASFSDYTPEFQIEAQDANPRVRCYDLRRLTGVQPETGEFFIFHQARTVAPVDLALWRLGISGCVARPMTLTMSDLLRRRAVDTATVFECSGNSGHAQLMNGLVGQATWSGPALAPVLRECGVLPEAREVVFFGMDGGTERKWAAREQDMFAPHGRSIFIQDAMKGSVMLATRMNGAPLPPDHGFPLRAIVPGWYGMTNVKWLNRILVLDRRYEGRHMARNYHSIRSSDSLTVESSISRMRLKSVVTRVVRQGPTMVVHGAAWTGGPAVTKVEVRVNDLEWEEATVHSGPNASSWKLWNVELPNIGRGTHRVVSRATDRAGAVQPDPAEWRKTFASSREDHSQWTRTVVLA